MTVVVPFLGADAEAAAALERLAALTLGPGDSVVVADNRPSPGRWPALPEGFKVVAAPGVCSSYRARNAGAARAGGEWILFLDADCRPPASLLDDYFEAPAGERAGILAGEVESVAADGSLIARWLVARRHLAVAPQLAASAGAAAGTANLMVRRAALEELGGFAEVRSGADYELCLRARAAGWDLEYLPGARVEHLHAGGLPQALARARRYGAGQAWLARVHPGTVVTPRPAQAVARAAAGLAWWGARGRFERASFKALDGAWQAAFALGWHRGSNAS